MIYQLKIKLTDGKIINNTIDSEGMTISYSDMIEKSPVSMETRKLTISAMDHKFHLNDMWQSIKNIHANEVYKLSILTEEGVEVFNITEPLTNIIYLINFHESGDMISFCYGKEN